jgi:hypothetical protein
MQSKTRQTCVRCGHETPDCPNCDKQDPILGASALAGPCCHTFSEVQPSCYTLTIREEDERRFGWSVPTTRPAPEEHPHDDRRRPDASPGGLTMVARREWWDTNGHKGGCPVLGGETTERCSCGPVPATKDFFVTFKGSAERKFAPVFTDGWARIVIATAHTGVDVMDDACEVAEEKFGTTWHLIRDEAPDEKSYPRGELFRIEQDVLGSYSIVMPGEAPALSRDTAEFAGQVFGVMQDDMRDTNSMLQDNIARQGIGAVRRIIVEQHAQGWRDWSFGELWEIFGQAETDIIDYLEKVRAGRTEEL